MAAVVGELRKNPEFYKIFADNTYDELMAKIEPFKLTGAVEKDYAYLLNRSSGSMQTTITGSKERCTSERCPPLPQIA